MRASCLFFSIGKNVENLARAAQTHIFKQFISGSAFPILRTAISRFFLMSKPSAIMSLRLLIPILLCILSATYSVARHPRPNALVAKVTQDAATLQYLIQLRQKTPLQKERLVLDLAGALLWVPCLGVYKSSTFRPVRCGSAACAMTSEKKCRSICFNSTPQPGCNNNTCVGFPDNNAVGFETTTEGDLSQDVLVVSTTDGRSQGPPVRIPRFVFSCAPDSLMKGLAKGAAGAAGMSWHRLAIPSQLAAAFSFRRKFALCLPSGGAFPGAVFFGNRPYFFGPGRDDVSRALSRTPLIKNSFFAREYYIGVTGIAVDGKRLPIPSDRLKIDSGGLKGTKLSSIVPYTQAATSIYSVIIDAFTKASHRMNISSVASVKPFDACFDAKTVRSTRLGAAVPSIDLVLQNDKTYWRIWGANSMISVSEDVLCLAIVDGGSSQYSPALVIGTYQMQDNLLEFDIATSSLGFSGSLLAYQTTCSNFNFTAGV